MPVPLIILGIIAAGGLIGLNELFIKEKLAPAGTQFQKEAGKIREREEIRKDVLTMSEAKAKEETITIKKTGGGLAGLLLGETTEIVGAGGKSKDAALEIAGEKIAPEKVKEKPADPFTGLIEGITNLIIPIIIIGLLIVAILIIMKVMK